MPGFDLPLTWFRERAGARALARMWSSKAGTVLANCGLPCFEARLFASTPYTAYPNVETLENALVYKWRGFQWVPLSAVCYSCRTIDKAA